MPWSTAYLPDTAPGYVCAARLDSQMQTAEQVCTTEPAATVWRCESHHVRDIKMIRGNPA